MADEASPLPQSRTAYVLERLKADLENGLINPGDQLRILAADGMIDYTSHRGATVRDYTPEMAQDLYRMRAELEALAVEVAVERMTPEALELILTANERLVDATAAGIEPSALSLLNKDLHFEIYQSTSPVMIECINLLWARFKPSVTLWGVHEFSVALDHDHVQILDAIKAGDGPAARAAMHAHVMHAYDLRQTNAGLRAEGGKKEPGAEAS
jgi:DNA-binding GntR family transcriptional regulator